jgi:hypothetical protein
LTVEQTVPRPATATGDCFHTGGSDAPLDTPGRNRDARHRTG